MAVRNRALWKHSQKLHILTFSSFWSLHFLISQRTTETNLLFLTSTSCAKDQTYRKSFPKQKSSIHLLRLQTSPHLKWVASGFLWITPPTAQPRRSARMRKNPFPPYGPISNTMDSQLKKLLTHRYQKWKNSTHQMSDLIKAGQQVAFNSNNQGVTRTKAECVSVRSFLHAHYSAGILIFTPWECAPREGCQCFGFT